MQYDDWQFRYTVLLVVGMILMGSMMNSAIRKDTVEKLSMVACCTLTSSVSSSRSAVSSDTASLKI